MNIPIQQVIDRLNLLIKTKNQEYNKIATEYSNHFSDVITARTNYEDAKNAMVEVVLHTVPKAKSLDKRYPNLDLTDNDNHRYSSCSGITFELKETTDVILAKKAQQAAYKARCNVYSAFDKFLRRKGINDVHYTERDRVLSGGEPLGVIDFMKPFMDKIAQMDNLLLVLKSQPASTSFNMKDKSIKQLFPELELLSL